MAKAKKKVAKKKATRKKAKKKVTKKKATRKKYQMFQRQDFCLGWADQLKLSML